MEFKEVVFHNRQRIGDMLMYTCAIRDFKKAFPNTKIGVCSTAMHIWDNNPYVDYTMHQNEFERIMCDDNIGTDIVYDKNKKDVLRKEFEGKIFVRIGPSGLTNNSNWKDWHFSNAYRISIEERLGISLAQGNSWGDIWFSKEEYDAPRVEQRPYWIIITGGEKGWGCKMYPTVRWQELIDKNPDILFYQLGNSGDKHEKLQGANVVDYIGKTESGEKALRDLFRLFLNAEGSIGLVSFHMHLMGALQKPCVVVAGAREPVSFTQYAGHRYLSNDGTLPCAIKACWACDISACKALVDMKTGQTVKLSDTPKGKCYGTDEERASVMPKCVDMISSDDVTKALQMYYIGGRLNKTKPAEKPKVNIGEAVIKPMIMKEKQTTDKTVETPKKEAYGMTFGGGALTERDWEFMQETFAKFKVESVLEFGAGLSTLLLNDKVKNVVTYEDKQEWIDKIKEINPKADVRLWDGVNLNPIPEKFDLAFVDGPTGGQSREFATYFATQESDILMIHDAGREFERKWQDKYIKDYYVGPFKGGHRCHLWIKAETLAKHTPKKDAPKPPVAEVKVEEKAPLRGTLTVSKSAVQVILPSTQKTIKFVSTARGFGGCARSITTIMDLLIKEGHKVEFIPFKIPKQDHVVSSRELKEIFRTTLKDVKVTENYDTVKDPCDILFMYGDDYIWEFNTPEVTEVFSNLKAEKRIMVLNYRRGPVGQASWTKDWDKYMFLNSIQEKELLKLLPNAKTKVLAPCTILDDFLLVKPNFEDMIKIVRHSSQGDTKFIAERPLYSKDSCSFLIDQALKTREDLTVSMLPGPSFYPERERFTRFPRTDKSKVIADYLSTGNLFWYSLPPGYPDMGPRVILEAMASGLPILADNWGGAVDRVTKECGWLCNSKDEHIEIIKNVTLKELKEKGEASRQRAIDNFISSNWVKEILNA